ncbi:KOW motif-containing protein [Streptacidiphilus fuscans]|uniref:KOW motif-containing protein n=1 Tax=Streptacidiphilus fuscans TaxID=2789292 RepID=A0A931B3K2_9ACTN|nr:KOW motif-containing protein [Streptacidiphilus fuscans]MBF9068007.1 KOW motif-containing protein [Streptacidiphilus fuscans]
MSDLWNLKAGDKVRVTRGPFAGDAGTVHSVDRERGRVRVLVLVFGDTTTVDLPRSDVERLAG